MTAVHSDDLELLERLGGTDATVHCAAIRATGRVVVVKRAPWDRPDVTDRLGREAAVLDRVRHPSLVRLLGRIDDEDGRTLVLAHAPGGSLAARLQRYGPLAGAEVSDVGARVAGALAALHRAGVVHRDVHPGNVVVDAELQPVLADLDHALDPHGGHLPGDDDVVGHPEYVDPRLFTGVPAGPASDLHSLATTLWTMATGEPPPRAGTGQPLHLPVDDRVPSVLRGVLDACLQGALDAAAAASGFHAAAAELLAAPSPAPSSAAPPSRPAALSPPGAPSTTSTSSRALVAGSGESSTRRWGPATHTQPPLGGPAERPLGRGFGRHTVPVLLGLVGLLIGGWLLAAATTSDPTASAGPAAASGAVPVVPPPACPGAADPTGAAAGGGPDPVLADLDGDGCSEALWLAEGVLHAPGGRYRVGEVGDVLVAGDWDGDGAWGVGLYRPGTGEVLLFDGAPEPGLRSRPAQRMRADGSPLVVAEGVSHRVVVEP